MEGLEPNINSLELNMKKAISQTDDLTIQAKMCSAVALAYAALMVDKHLV